MGLKLSTKKGRGRSYSFTEKDKAQKNSDATQNNAGNNGSDGTGGSKKSRRCKSTAAKFSNTRESYIPKSSETPANGNQQQPETNLNIAGITAAATAAISSVADVKSKIESVVVGKQELAETGNNLETPESNESKSESTKTTDTFSLQSVLECVKKIDPDVECKIKEAVQPVIEQAEKIIPEPIKEKIREFIKPSSEPESVEAVKESEPIVENLIKSEEPVKETEPIVSQQETDPIVEAIKEEESLPLPIKEPEITMEQLEQAPANVENIVIDNNIEKIETEIISEPQSTVIEEMKSPETPTIAPPTENILNGDKNDDDEESTITTSTSQTIESAKSHSIPEPMIVPEVQSVIINQETEPPQEPLPMEQSESKIDNTNEDISNECTESKPDDNQMSKDKTNDLKDKTNDLKEPSLLEPALSNDMASLKIKGSKPEEEIIPVGNKLVEHQMNTATNITNGHHVEELKEENKQNLLDTVSSLAEQNGSDKPQPELTVEVPGEIVSL